MKTINFTINVAAIDCYVYGGYLFIIRINGDVVYIPMSRIMHKLYDKYPQYKSLLIMAFSRNDYFSNTIGQLFLGIPEVFMAMKYAWKNASEKMIFSLEWKEIEEESTVICDIKSPVLDVRMYAMRLFLGCKDGLYESNLFIDEDKYTIHPEKIKKRFDAKVVGLNSGFGSVIISSGRDGLFNAPIEENKSIIVNDRPESAVSYRTGWSRFDIINYKDASTFEYYKNDIQKLQRQVRYSKYDDSGETIKLVGIGTERYSMDEMLSKTKILPQDIIFSFNSSQSAFLCTKEGIYITNLLCNDKQERKDIYLSAKKRIISHSKQAIINKPISASVVPAGCVVEFYDNVVLFQGNQTVKIENEATMRVRTFMNSLRYKNIIATIKMNDITLHSLAPFDTYKFVPQKKSLPARLINANTTTHKGELPF